MKEALKILFEPQKIGSLVLKNRFALAPMGGAQFYGARGEFTDLAVDFYAEYAKNGYSLMFVGAQQVDNQVDKIGRPSVLTSPAAWVQNGLRMTERVHAADSKIIPQLSMGLARCGRGAGISWGAPSEFPMFWDPSLKTHEFTKDEIKRKIDLMVQAAAQAKRAGFDGVEMHAMHAGYLLDMFAMSIFNQRTDEYGGVLENRMRVAKELVQGVKQECGDDYPVLMRIGLKSYIKGLEQPTLYGEEEAGRTVDEAVEIVKMLASYGYDAIDADMGVYDSFYYIQPPMYMEKGCWLPTVAEVKKQCPDIPFLTAGRMQDPYMDAKAVADGVTDMVSLGRCALAEPEFVKKVYMGREDTIRPCIACNNGCIGHMLMHGGETLCAVNPAAGRPKDFGITKALEPKNVMVVGGGVAGMEAARTAARRGHHVEIYEMTDQLGGNLIPAGKHDFKVDIASLNQWYQRELSELKVNVHFNTKVTPEMIKYEKPDVAILAVGSTPVTPRVPGIDNKIVSGCVEALTSGKEPGHKIVVVGGGLVGCEFALDLANAGKQVTIVEMLDDILSGGPVVPYMNTLLLRTMLKDRKVELKTGMKLMRVTNHGVEIEPRTGGDTVLIEADTVITSVGFRPRPSMARDLAFEGIDVYEIGDGRKVGDIMTAVTAGYEIARAI